MNPFALLAFIALALMPFETIIADKSAVIFFYLALLFMALWFWREGQNPFSCVGRSLREKNRLVQLGLGAFALALAASTPFALDPAHSLEATGRVLVMGISSFTILALAKEMEVKQPDTLKVWAIFAVFAAASLLLADQTWRLLPWLTGEERANHYNNFAALLLSVFIFTALGVAFAKGWAWGLALLAVAGAALFATENQSAQLGFLLGLATLLGYRLVKTLSLRQLCLIGLVVYFGSLSQFMWRDIIVALGADQGLPFSYEHRLLIWEAYTQLIFAQPWTGYGLDSSELMFSLEAYKPFLDASVTLIPIHPHNAAMALWLELGVLGLIAGALLLIIVARGIKTLNTALQPYASAALFSALVQLLLSRHPLQSTLFLGLVGVAVVFVMLEKAYRQNKREEHKAPPSPHSR